MTGKNKALSTAQQYATEIVKIFNSIAGARTALNLFDDWLEGNATALLGATDCGTEPYVKWITQAKAWHTPEINRAYEHVTELLVAGLEATREDILGPVYEMLGTNRALGQCFTPYGVARAMAEINMEGVEKTVNEKGFCTINDCCCGSGVLLIAQVEAARKHGIPKDKILVAAGDIDARCVKMTACQLEILHYVAVVRQADGLNPDAPTGEMYMTTNYAMKTKPLSNILSAAAEMLHISGLDTGRADDGETR